MDDAEKRRIREKLGRALKPMATRIERVSVRFDDINGPRGGIDTLCRARVVLSGHESILVEQRGHNPEHALRLVTPRLRRSLQRSVERVGGKAPAPTLPPPAKRPGTRARSSAAPASRSSPRTIKTRTHGMTASLEAPSDKPSRKSTRDSSNRAKAGGPKGARHQASETLADQATHPRQVSPATQVVGELLPHLDLRCQTAVANAERQCGLNCLISSRNRPRSAAGLAGFARPSHLRRR